MIFGMNTRTVMMVAVALIAAAATALLVRGWLNAQKVAMDKKPGPPAIEVLVVKENVPAGSFIRPQSLRWQAWPEGTLAPTYAVKGKREPKEFEGAVVRTGIAAGQPITDTLVVRPGDQGFLAAVLDPGKRAVSIQVNATSGISGFVFPGDRVDMVLTHTIGRRDKNTQRHVSETVLQDIRVLAVDQKTDDQNNKAAIAKTVTFEVTPKQVEKIGIINKLGRLSLSLRPVAREALPEPEPENTETAEEPRPHAGLGTAPPARRPAAPQRATSLSAIPAASAAEVPSGEYVPEDYPEEAADGEPVSLIRVEPDEAASEDEAQAEDDSAAASEAAANEGETESAPVDEAEMESASLDEAETEVAAREPAPPPEPARSERILSEEELIPPGERAGITMDTEVSRVVGRHRRAYRPTVQIVRGSKKIEHRRF